MGFTAPDQTCFDAALGAGKAGAGGGGCLDWNDINYIKLL